MLTYGVSSPNNNFAVEYIEFVFGDLQLGVMYADADGKEMINLLPDETASAS